MKKCISNKKKRDLELHRRDLSLYRGRRSGEEEEGEGVESGNGREVVELEEDAGGGEK